MYRWFGPVFGGAALFLAATTAAAQGGYSVVSSGGGAGPTAAGVNAPATGPVVPGPIVPATPPGTNTIPLTAVPGPVVSVPTGSTPPLVSVVPGPVHFARSQGSMVLPGIEAPPPIPVESIVPTRHGSHVTSHGDEVIAPRHPDEYGGVSPGNHSIPPGFRRMMRAAHGAPLVEWPGFQMVPGGSRVFVAMSSQPTVTESRPRLQQVVYHLAGARVFLSNNRRPLITEAFETPMARATLRSVGHSVDLVIDLRAPAEPRMSQQAGAGGLSYLFVDFPAWTSPTIPHLRLPNIEVNSGVGPIPPSVPQGMPVMPSVQETERPPGIH